jgi:hypothetical protein
MLPTKKNLAIPLVMENGRGTGKHDPPKYALFKVSKAKTSHTKHYKSGWRRRLFSVVGLVWIKINALK